MRCEWLLDVRRLSNSVARGQRPAGNSRVASLRVLAQAVATEAPATTTSSATPDNQYQLTTLTTWLLRQEQLGNIDNEHAVVISSIALACKQIASLVNRSGISNLTGELTTALLSFAWGGAAGDAHCLDRGGWARAAAGQELEGRGEVQADPCRLPGRALTKLLPCCCQ